jgi:hypothetical protein
MTEREPLVFVKSTFSQNGDCVEWAARDGWIRLRDSKNPRGHTFDLSAPDWADFTVAVAAGTPSPVRLRYHCDELGTRVWDTAHSLRFTRSEWRAFVAAIESGEVLRAS